MKKGEIIAKGSNVSIQADDGPETSESDVEIVTDPFENKESALSSIRLAHEYLQFLIQQCDQNKKSLINDRYRIEKKNDKIHYRPQATIPIPLTKMKEALGYSYIQPYDSKEGFVVLVKAYLTEMKNCRDFNPLKGPKAAFPLMARNDFGTLFKESGITKEEWEGEGEYSYTKILNDMELDKEPNLFPFPTGIDGKYYYKNDPAKNVNGLPLWKKRWFKNIYDCTLTYKEWLKGFSAETPIDYLKGGDNTTCEGMGKYGKSLDDGLPFFEIRGTTGFLNVQTTLGNDWGDFEKYIKDIFEKAESLNRKNDSTAATCEPIRSPRC